MKRRFSEKLLQWHYRSKYEELINYSNHAFYNGHKKAFDNAINRILNGNEKEYPPLPPVDPDDSTILTDEIKQQVLKRDNFQCLCCGKERRRGVSLEIDHILPVAMGGKNVPSNLQTLCKQCNGIKGVNEIDYHLSFHHLALQKKWYFLIFQLVTIWIIILLEL